MNIVHHSSKRLTPPMSQRFEKCRVGFVADAMGMGGVDDAGAELVRGGTEGLFVGVGEGGEFDAVRI